MAAIIPLDSVIVSSVRPDSLSIIHETHTRRYDRVEPHPPLTPLQEMQPDGTLRQRARQETSSPPLNNNDERTENANETLTPSGPVETPQRQYLGRLQSLFASHKSVEEIEAYNNKHGYDRIIKEKMGDFAMGFPRLAYWQRSDDDGDLMMFRAFHQSHIRIILHDQVEITETEKELQRLDKEDEGDPRMSYRLRSTLQRESRAAQMELLEKHRSQLERYDKFLLQYFELRSYYKPNQANYMSVFNWIINRKPLMKGYYDFMYHEGDFVTPMKRTQADMSPTTNIFASFVRFRLIYWIPFLKKFTITATERGKSLDPHVQYYSGTKIAILTRVLTVLVSIGAIMIPTSLLLFQATSRGVLFAIVLAFVAAFSMLLSVAADAKLETQFFGTVAYGALLSAFLSGMNQNCKC